MRNSMLFPLIVCFICIGLVPLSAQDAPEKEETVIIIKKKTGENGEEVTEKTIKLENHNGIIVIDEDGKTIELEAESFSLSGEDIVLPNDIEELLESKGIQFDWNVDGEQILRIHREGEGDFENIIVLDELIELKNLDISEQLEGLKGRYIIKNLDLLKHLRFWLDDAQ